MLSNAMRMKFIVQAAATSLALVACSDKDEKAPTAGPRRPAFFGRR